MKRGIRTGMKTEEGKTKKLKDRVKRKVKEDGT